MRNQHLTVWFQEVEVRELEVLARSLGLSRHALLQKLVREGMDAALHLSDEAQAVEEARLVYDRRRVKALDGSREAAKRKIQKKLSPANRIVALHNEDNEEEAQTFFKGLESQVQKNVVLQLRQVDEVLASRYEKMGL